MDEINLPDQEIRYIGELQRLVLQPGDIIVLTIDADLTDKALGVIEEHMSTIFPGHKVLCLTQGVKIGIINPSNEDDLRLQAVHR
ncbi:MAG: hypothetical protein E6Q97_25315 [Desulfurellales bacterium]|nr:MAG: hypothetical protein E6Q97_25315 [Desulfurellales bacterium]